MEPCDPALLLSRYARNGCQESFALLVRRYAGLLYRAALPRLNGDAAAAEDVVQRVFLDLASEAERLESCPHVGRWLYRRAVWLAADVNKADRRRRAREAKAVEGMGPDQACDEDRRDRVEAVKEALRRLSPGDQEALRMRFLDECSMRAIGERFGLSDDAAQKRVSRALQRMRGLLRGRGLGSITGVISMLAGVASVPAGMAGALAGAGSVAMAVRRGRPLFFLQTTMKAKIIGLSATVVLLVVGIAVPWFRSSVPAGSASGTAPAAAPQLARVSPPPIPLVSASAQPVAPPGPAGEADSDREVPDREGMEARETNRQQVEAVTQQRYEEKMQRLQRKLDLTPAQAEQLAEHHRIQREKWIEYLTGAAENRADPRHYSLEAGYREDVPPALQSMLSAEQLERYRAYDENKRTNHIEAVTSGEINYLAQRLDLDPTSKDALFAELARINQRDLFADLSAVADLQTIAQQADQDVARRRAAFGQVLDAHQMQVWESVVADYRRGLLQRFGWRDQTAGEPQGAVSGRSS